ncbi:MAG: glycosyl hydrolase [Faecalimonas sp.]|nr:glycosyl hydrolase [Faecalimonas sp.]
MMRRELRQEFLTPSDEFTPMPFWFWNDTLSEQEITRQIDDFCEKGVMGFIIHPRKGIPKEIPYLSDVFMHYVKHAVVEAEKRGMKVILYDEAMYPSGSAHGLVVKDNPEYATRALRIEEYNSDSGECKPNLATEEMLLAVVLATKNDKGEIIPETIQNVRFPIVNQEDKSVFFLIEGYSHGTIRGIHIGEDDGEKGAPASGDLLNPDAMRKFIHITYDRYYEVLKDYFGTTVIGMFTDEPAELGRCARRGSKPWTVGFDKYWEQTGGKVEELPLLWLSASDATHEDVRRRYKKTVYQRLSESYYQQISQWCEDHGIALAGHPGESDDIGLLKYFHIPGQDLVWRYVAPEEEKAFVGRESTMGKCSSDAARHSGKRRNSNECFGCCGPNGIQWAFTVDNMKWYLDWMFVRGVNLLYPHAFFYSIDGEVRSGERPPDVGPNNTFWKYYKNIANYIKRMCWLMTDSYNVTPIAVLCEEAYLPWESVKELYCNQIEFNYLEKEVLTSNNCREEAGWLKVKKQAYRVLIIESKDMIRDVQVSKTLNEFKEHGGHVIYWDEVENIIDELDNIWSNDSQCKRDVKLISGYSSSDIRVSHVVKGDEHFYLFTNEGEEVFYGMVQLACSDYKDGSVECWDAWDGTQKEVSCHVGENSICTSLVLGRRESKILCVNNPTVIDISNQFDLTDWCEREGMDDFSGTVAYETTIDIDSPDRRIILDLGTVHEIAELIINDQVIGVRMWAPYQFDISGILREGVNTIKINVSNTPANKLENTKLASGILGAVRLLVF